MCSDPDANAGNLSRQDQRHREFGPVSHVWTGYGMNCRRLRGETIELRAQGTNTLVTATYTGREDCVQIDQVGKHHTVVRVYDTLTLENGECH